VGIDAKDLSEDKDSGGEFVATYDYTDESGQLLFQVCRKAPKAFVQRRPDGNGGWAWSTKGVRRVLYRLPKVLEAVKAGTPIYVVEGEKDVHAIEEAGGVATTCPGGAGRWRAEYAEALGDAEVIVVADADQTGREHANDIVRSLNGNPVRVVRAAEGKDAADHLAAGHGIDDFQEGAVEVPDAAALLAGVATYIRRFVRVSPAQVATLALWVAHTHAFEASRRTPYIIVTSPREECGKSLLLEVMALLVARAWSMEGPPSEAVLFRKIAQDEPTVLFDESEAIFGRSERFEGMRSVILGGNRRGATVPRCFGPNRDQIRDFGIYAPKAFAAIKASAWPRTQLSRSIVIKMQRLLPDEQVEDFYSDVEEDGEGQLLHDKLAAWAVGAVDELKRMRPERLPELGPRAFEGWVPLLNIADLAGGKWPEFGRRCAIELSSGTIGSGSDLDLELLSDIREVFERERTDRMWSTGLVGHLNELEESGWGGWNDGKGMKQKELANKLAPYDIRPKTIRIGDKAKRGYLLEQFQGTFSRYLPAETDHLSATSATTAQTSHKPGAEQPQHGGHVADGGGAENPHSNADVADVADKRAEHGGTGPRDLFTADYGDQGAA
jgi:5S rRNA maturation endonuclease (ribonuclease M5)